MTTRPFLGDGAGGSNRPVGLGGCQPLRAQVRHRLTGQSGKPTANPVERLFEYLRSGGIAGVGRPGFSSPTGLGHPCTGPAPVLACVLVTRTTDPVVQFGDPILVERGHRLSFSYHADSALVAQAQLEALAKELERTHPGAAGSLREGLAETLTVLRTGRLANVDPHAAFHQQHRVDDLHRPHPLQQRQELAERDHGAALVRRRDDRARGQFRRVNGHLHLPAFRAALDAHVAAETVGTVRHDEPVIAA